MHNRKKNSNKEIGLIAYMAVFFIEKYEQDELEKLKKIHLVLDTAIHCCDSHDADMDNQGVLDRLQTAKQSYPSPDFAARHQKKSFYRTILDFFLGLFEKIIQYFSSSPHRAKTNDVTSTAPEEKNRKHSS